jgi:protease-4
MSLEVDLLLDRRHLKRRLIFWRAAAVLAVAAAILIAIGGKLPLIGSGARVAVLRVDGIITDDPARDAAVERLANEPAVKALIVRIDSPGGSVAGGEALHDAIARVAAKKPVVAVMGPVAASAAYMVAVATDRIFAREGTLTGSIGVLLQAGEVSGLLKKLGITAETFVSGPLKDQPSLTAPVSAQGREVLQGLVDNLYEQFVAMVAAGRHMSMAAVKPLADGRAYTGQQALNLGLIDMIGGERAARAWLAKEKGVSERLPEFQVESSGFAERALGARFGGLLKIFLSQEVNLDGAWAIWQPAERLR